MKNKINNILLTLKLKLSLEKSNNFEISQLKLWYKKFKDYRK